MQLQTNNNKVWQAARTGNSPTKLATLRQKDRRQKDRQITVPYTACLCIRFANDLSSIENQSCFCYEFTYKPRIINI